MFGSLNRTYESLIWAIENPIYGEVTWFYPHAAQTTCTRYVTYNYRENHWAIGTLGRCAGAAYAVRIGRGADTSNAPGQVPFYEFPDPESMILPKGVELVGVEIVDEAIELPSFRHPRQAAYVLGAERVSLPPALLARCAHTVRIPTRFSVNVALAGAIVMYDRLISLGRFARRPLTAGGVPEPVPEHVYGSPRFRKAAARFRTAPAPVVGNASELLDPRP